MSQLEMNMRVKICGITNIEDAHAAVEYGADALGFVFAKSPRQVTKGQARDIIEKLPPFVSPVGVFVDEKVDKIKEICDFCGIHTVQLHGNESPLYLNDLKGYKIIKAFRVKEEDDLKQLANYKPHDSLHVTIQQKGMGFIICQRLQIILFFYPKGLYKRVPFQFF